MVTLAIDEICILLALISVGLAVRKWHIIRDRHLILSVVKNAMKERKALLIGTVMGIFYLAVFVILGGKGGRVHVLFGRLVLNTSPGEMLAGFSLAILVTVSMTLFVYAVHVIGLMPSGKKAGIGFFGVLSALLAAFCP